MWPSGPEPANANNPVADVDDRLPPNSRGPGTHHSAFVLTIRTVAQDRRKGGREAPGERQKFAPITTGEDPTRPRLAPWKAWHDLAVGWLTKAGR
jgi:hypothetical protein